MRHLGRLQRGVDEDRLQADIYTQNDIDCRLGQLKKETRNNLSFLALAFLILVMLNVPYTGTEAPRPASKSGNP